jgi:hypothetical protein
MRYLYFLLAIAVSLLTFSSCKDIVAEDISNRIPELIIPTLNDTVMQNPVMFKWEEMEGATKYHLQVVSPSFSTISDYVLDTIVSGTTFSFPLDSNQFELKLTAMNGGYTSQTLGPIKFWVGLSPTTNTSSIVLQTPLDGIYTNESFAGPFTWQTLSGATSYEYSLRKGSSFANGSIELTQNNIVTNTFTLPGNVTLTEGTYYWGVKGYYSSGETIFSVRSFSVDTNEPGTPSLISPSNMSFLSAGSISFSWGMGSNGGTVQSPVHNVIEVSTDSGFSTIVETDDILGTSINYTLAAGTYYWRVYSFDEAGNTSSYSSINTFTLN